MLISIVPLCILLAYSFLSLCHKNTLISFIVVLVHLFGLGLFGTGLFYERTLFSCSLILLGVLVAFSGAALLYFLQKIISDVFASSYRAYRFLLPSGIFYMLLFCILGVGGVDKITREKPAVSMKYAWQEVSSSLKDASASLYIFRHYEEVSSLLWYARRIIPIIDYEGGDLLYGKSKNLPKPQSPFVSSQEIKLSPQDLIFMHKKALPLYRETPLFPITQEVYQKGDVVVFSPTMPNML